MCRIAVCTVCDCQEGRTALHYAAVCGHVDAVRLLITAGCDINARDQVHAVKFTCISTIKGQLNLDNKWQLDALVYIIMNEIHPRFNQF